MGDIAGRSDERKGAEAFQLGNPDELALELSPSRNIVPAAMRPAVVEGRDADELVLRVMRWGLIPAWRAGGGWE